MGPQDRRLPPLSSTSKTSTTSKSHKKAAPSSTAAKNTIPRPPNAFILYRNVHQPLLVESHRGQGMSSRDFSAMIGAQWRNEDALVKQHFQDEAKTRMLQHRVKYPDYKYRPSKKNPSMTLTAGTTTSAISKNKNKKKSYDSDSDSNTSSDEDDLLAKPKAPFGGAKDGGPVRKNLDSPALGMRRLSSRSFAESSYSAKVASTFSTSTPAPPQPPQPLKKKKKAQIFPRIKPYSRPTLSLRSGSTSSTSSSLMAPTRRHTFNSAPSFFENHTGSGSAPSSDAEYVQSSSASVFSRESTVAVQTEFEGLSVTEAQQQQQQQHLNFAPFEILAAQVDSLVQDMEDGEMDADPAAYLCPLPPPQHHQAHHIGYSTMQILPFNFPIVGGGNGGNTSVFSDDPTLATMQQVFQFDEPLPVLRQVKIEATFPQQLQQPQPQQPSTVNVQANNGPVFSYHSHMSPALTPLMSSNETPVFAHNSTPILSTNNLHHQDYMNSTNEARGQHNPTSRTVTGDSVIAASDDHLHVQNHQVNKKLPGLVTAPNAKRGTNPQLKLNTSTPSFAGGLKSAGLWLTSAKMLSPMTCDVFNGEDLLAARTPMPSSSAATPRSNLGGFGFGFGLFGRRPSAMLEFFGGMSPIRASADTSSGAPGSASFW